MHPSRAKKTARPFRGRARVRTSGAPRLVEPGGPNNRDSDTWGIVWSDAGRSRRFRTTARSEDDAKRALQEFLNARAATQYLVTVNDVLDLDLKRIAADHKEKKRRPALLKERTRALKPIRAYFGTLPPETIEGLYVDAYETKRISEGVGKRTVSIELAYLRAALKEAKRKGKISAMPEITLPQAKARARRRVLTRKELSRLMAAINDEDKTPLHLRGFVMLSLHTGQRGIHIKNLLWEHVDDGMINYTLSNPNAAENKQCADMPITRGLAPVLEQMQRAARTKFVIEWDGAQVGSVKTAFAALCKRAGLADFHVHDIRRSFATLGAIKDIPIEDLAGMMNVDQKTLRAHYNHGISDRTRKMIEQIGGDE